VERRRQLRRKELEAQKRFHGSLYVSVLSVRSGPAPHTIPGFAPVSRSTNPSRERAQGQGQGGSGANVFLLPVGRGAGNCAPEHDRLTRVSGPPASPRLAPPRASGPPHVCASDHGHRRSMEWEQDFSLQVVASQPRLGLLRPPTIAPCSSLISWTGGLGTLDSRALRCPPAAPVSRASCSVHRPLPPAADGRGACRWLRRAASASRSSRWSRPRDTRRPLRGLPQQGKGLRPRRDVVK
jgi:hypothetical protein